MLKSTMLRNSKQCQMKTCYVCAMHRVYTGYKMWKVYVFNSKSKKISINIHILTIRNIRNSSSPGQLGGRWWKGSFKVSHKNSIFNYFEGIFWIVSNQMTQFMHIIHYRDSQLINKSCLRWKNRNFLT